MQFSLLLNYCFESKEKCVVCMDGGFAKEHESYELKNSREKEFIYLLS